MDQGWSYLMNPYNITLLAQNWLWFDYELTHDSGFSFNIRSRADMTNIPAEIPSTAKHINKTHKGLQENKNSIRSYQ